ncbi:hypothetical protein BN988_02861 [Oceanobacillus picturae]|uniref:CopG family transcriptional regulator n=1 Tax=Oceanobacillus picturae TaxID=171693 RepID=W9AN19_9BACI|nr:hypothetical protein [Oceanobacillus picturae]CDO04307.1 hypothetical protein BN988_02861 [Oceanobacillus picturae]
MPNARYTISILSKDSELIQYIENKRKSIGLSAYIRELIRNDKEKQDTSDLEQIYEYVAKRMKEDGLHIDNTGAQEAKKFIDEQDKEIIMDLF